MLWPWHLKNLICIIDHQTCFGRSAEASWAARAVQAAKDAMVSAKLEDTKVAPGWVVGPLGLKFFFGALNKGPRNVVMDL